MSWRGKVSQDESDTNKFNDSDDDSDKPLSSRSRKKNGKLAPKKPTRTRKQVNYTEDEEAGEVAIHWVMTMVMRK